MMQVIRRRNHSQTRLDAGDSEIFEGMMSIASVPVFKAAPYSDNPYRQTVQHRTVADLLVTAH